MKLSYLLLPFLILVTSSILSCTEECIVESCPSSLDDEIRTKDSLSLIRYLRSVNDTTIVNIANSTQNDGLPGNTKEHFVEALKHGFNAIKADTQITKDGGIILCHDNGFTFNELGRIINYNPDNCVLIKDLFLAEILGFEFQLGAEQLGYFCHPIELSSFLNICKKNKIIPYITIRNDNEEETCKRVIKEIKRFKLENKAIINSFPPSLATCEIVRALDPFIGISYTIGANSLFNDELIDVVSSLGNAFICVQKDNLIATPKSVWQYAATKDIRIYGCEVFDRIDYMTLIERGCSGFQLSNISILENGGGFEDSF